MGLLRAKITGGMFNTGQVVASVDVSLYTKRHNTETGTFINVKYAKKRAILNEKRESGWAFEKRYFLLERGNADTWMILNRI